MLHKSLVALAAAAITVTAFSVLPAEARRKTDKQYNVQPSLDGRVTGRPRTCGYDYFQYGSRGIPHGPYCH